MSALPVLQLNDQPPIQELKRQRGLVQAYQLRDLASRQALAIDALPETKDPKEVLSRSQSILALIRAWESASDRIRILRGTPLPGSRRPPPQRAARGAGIKPLTAWNQAEPKAEPVTPLDQAPDQQTG